MPVQHHKTPGTVRIITILFTLMALLGCSFMQSLVPHNANQPNESQPGSTSDEQNQSGVQIMDESYEPARYEFPNLGSISFQMDPASGTSREVSVGDALVEMQLVDAAGLTWTLSIPPGALETAQTLRMIPLTDLQSSTVPGLVSGIAFEPDGLEFRLPLRLSVSGPGLDEHTLILSGTHKGEGVDYALHDMNAPEPTAQLLHFSSYFASRPSDPEMQKIYKEYYEQYMQALKEANKIFKKDTEAPEPPSIPLECPDEKTGQENGQKVAEFVKKAMEPELQLIVRMLSIRRMLALTGVEDAGVPGEVELMLMDRLYYKASEMLTLYRNQDDKLLAVADFTFQVARGLQILHAGGSERGAALLQDLSRWYERLVDKLLDDIKQNHNYKKIPLVLHMYRNAALLGGTGERTEEIIEKLERALHFEVQIRFDMRLTNMNWVTESTVKLQFTANQLTTCNGQGQGVYTLATVPEPESIQTSSYPIKVMIKDFNPCEGTVTIGLDRFGADHETYVLPTIDGTPDLLEMPLVDEGGRSLYEGHADGGMYWFTMKVQNGNSTAAEEHFERSTHDEIFGDLAIKLIHMPE